MITFPSGSVSSLLNMSNDTSHRIIMILLMTVNQAELFRWETSRKCSTIVMAAATAH